MLVRRWLMKVAFYEDTDDFLAEIIWYNSATNL